MSTILHLAPRLGRGHPLPFTFHLLIFLDSLVRGGLWLGLHASQRVGAWAAAQQTPLFVLAPLLVSRGQAQAHIPTWGVGRPATLPPIPLGVMGVLGGGRAQTLSPLNGGMAALPHCPLLLSGMALTGLARALPCLVAQGGRMGLCGFCLG